MDSKIKDAVVVKATTIVSTIPNSKCVRFTQAKEIELKLDQELDQELDPDRESESESKLGNDRENCKVDMHVIATLWDQYDHHIFSVNEHHYAFSLAVNDGDDPSDLTGLKFEPSGSSTLAAFALEDEDAPKWIVNSVVFFNERGKLCARLKIAVEYPSFDAFDTLSVDDLQSVEGQLLIKIRRQ